MKKGQVSSQFNWVFILIAGVIILTFFISIVNKQKEQADVKISANVLNAFDTLIKSSVVKDRTTQIITMPKQDIEFYCELDTCTVHGCYSGYRVKGTGVSVGAEITSIFSPTLIQGSKLITSNLDWNMPFRVSNLLYVTTNQNRYVFVNDTQGYLKKYLSVIPDNITMDIVESVEEVNDLNYYNLRYILFNEDDNDILSYDFLKSKGGKNSKNVSIVNLKFDSDGIGSASYFRSDLNIVKQEDESVFFDNATMVASIFSEDAQIYSCNMLKSFNQYLKLASIYEYKLRMLDEKFDEVSTNCGSYPYIFDGQQSLIALAIEKIERIVKNKIIDKTNVEQLQTQIKNLKQLNSRKRDDSCPVIY